MSEMFVNTKMDDGPCELVHSDELKEKFERDNDPYKYDALIERDFLARINDIDRSIKVIVIIMKISRRRSHELMNNHAVEFRTCYWLAVNR
jgi:LUC7 N_terminus